MKARAAAFDSGYRIALTAALLVHALLLAVLLRDLSLFDSAGITPELRDLALLVAATFAALLALLSRVRFHGGAAVTVACTGVAFALLTPGAVVSVLLLLMNAALIGDRFLSCFVKHSPSKPTTSAIVSALAGFSLWIALLTITATFEVHYTPVYVVLLVLPFLVFRGRIQQVVVVARDEWVNSNAPSTWTERAWLAMIGTVIVVHLLLVAKPEVGFDAMATHLQFAQLIASHHRWSFDVTPHVWAVMPLGGDFALAVAYLVGGEPAARLLNLCFGIAACGAIHQLVRLVAHREIALASTCLLGSMPLAFLISSSLFNENLCIAYLLTCLLLAIYHVKQPCAWSLAAFALLAAGAMQTKVTSFFWLTPVAGAVVYGYWRRRDVQVFDRTLALTMILAGLLAIFPYANAWMRTGNPVFPFMNDHFRSPYFYTHAPFVNWLYQTPLSIWTPYEVALSSGRFIEGKDGAIGFQWLLLLPLVVLGTLRSRSRMVWACMTLAVFYFVSVFVEQAYLRYLLPALILFAIVGGWSLAQLPRTFVARASLFAISLTLVLVNLRFIYTAGWSNATLCLSCAFDPEARAKYLRESAPQRIVGQFLNETLPEARIGFLVINGSGPAGYVGYARSAHWHDYETFNSIVETGTGEDVLALTRRLRLTHAVVRDIPTAGKTDPIGLFRDRYATPIWRFGGYAVLEIKPEVPQ